MLTVKELAAELKVSVWKAYRLVESRAIGHHKIGGAVRVSEAQLAEYLESTKRDPRQTSSRPTPQPPQKLKHLRLR